MMHGPPLPLTRACSLCAPSVDWYHTMGRKRSYLPHVRAFYENHIFPKLHPHQRVLVLPGAFASTHNPHCKVGAPRPVQRRKPRIDDRVHAHVPCPASPVALSLSPDT